MKRFGLLLVAAVLAALAPWLHQALGDDPVRPRAEFSGWPKTFEGAELRPLPMSEQQRRFTKGFAGKTARFHDGQREVVMRWLDRPSRRLHPASHCYLAYGYEVEPQAMHRDANGQRWSSFLATRDGRSWLVREAVFDQADGQWSDVSAWYWAAWRQQSKGPWWSYIVAEPVASPPT